MKIKKMITKIALLVLSFSILCGCTAVNTNNDTLPGSPAVNITTTQNNNSSAQPVSEWGFSNIENYTMDSSACILVGIEGYDIEKGYVVCAEEPTCIQMKDGLLTTIRLHVSDFSYEIYRGPYEYTVNSNDVITFAGDSSVTILERITSDTHNWVIFKTQDHFADRHTRQYIPATLVDFSTFYTDLDGNSGYKLIP